MHVKKCCDKISLYRQGDNAIVLKQIRLIR
jgi:hypothetical protein